ncbi:MAG TPA: Gfo/Idh/MocA family oxidoreductase [Pirellulales bacterium]|nr:Gfo/Idh/MocA family oxidoreductase [Pirellulales bacterium]
MPDRITVGLITNPEGAHLSDYLAALAASDEVEAVALADHTGQIEAAARKALGEKLHGIYRDPATMLRETKPALALVTLEAALAPPAIDAALEFGCHVLTEKPACLRAEDFAALVEKAEKKHLEIMLALANRLHAPVQEAKRLVAAGMLGKVYGAELHIIADQTRLRSAAYHRQWYAQKRRAGGGHLIWLGIHWLDLALYISGLTVRDVAGFIALVGGQPIDVEDSAAVVLRFDNGSLGTLTSGYYLDRGYHSHVQLWGEHGWLRLASFEEQPLEWYSTAAGQPATIQRFAYPQGGRSYTPFVRACARFAAGLAPAPITSRECLHVLQTIFACYRAAESGQSQRLSSNPAD